MLPNPIIIGPLSISYYGLMVAVGVLAALFLFSLTAPRRGLKPSEARDFCFWMVLAGLLGSRVAYVIFHWNEFGGQAGAMLAYWRGGLMFQGGVAAALLVSPLILKLYGLKFWAVADVMAPSLALGQAFGRLGCFSVGCCFGRPVASDHPLGLIFPEGSLAPAGLSLWPTQPAESAGLFLLALGLTLIIRAGNHGLFGRPGRVAALYLFASGLLRLVMESFRGDYRGEAVFMGLAPTTVTALAAAAAGLTLLLIRKNRAD